MFFMGEEIVAQKRRQFDNIATSKEDLHGERAGDGARMFRYYQDLIRLRRANPAVRSHSHRHRPRPRLVPGDRLHAAAGEQRAAGRREPEQPSRSGDGYVIRDRRPIACRRAAGRRRSTATPASTAGNDVGNFGAAIPALGGRIRLRLPANGLLVLQRR